MIFDVHLRECRDAVAVFDHLEKAAGFKADFNLRFVWIAAVSAMDHYISQVILERATYAYGNNIPLQGKLLADGMTFSNAIALRQADPVNSVLIFRQILDGVIRFKSFQHPDKISDGLAYIWPEKHKWKYISEQLGAESDAVKRKLSAIVDRRNLIAHNGDYDEGLGRKLAVTKSDAEEVINFIGGVVAVIDAAVAP
ncbi:HEPN domain-containing protein [Shinella sp.]|uniref:HEPN domain-containing protein n=1 Tax=Shinella sp. TaxID=1870904 RepID=UPI003D276EA4